MNEQDISKTLALVIVGFDVIGIDKFKQEIESKSILKSKGFEKGKMAFVPGPPGVSPFPMSFAITNNHFLSVEYNLLEKKLIITQKNYREDDFDYDKNILDILNIVLTITPASSIRAFGINYSTDVLKNEKLALFNRNIETQLGQEFWDTNIGFKTELAFEDKENNCTSVYRIFKNEQLSQEKNGRYYSFDVNFNFDLNEDNNATKIIEIFQNNDYYYNLYNNKKRNILDLCHQ